MQKLNKELNDNKKLSESKYANEILKLITFLATQPMDTIEMVCDKIKGFDQELFKQSIELDKKSLEEFGKYAYFIASKEQKDNTYCMPPNEISTNVFNYFTDNLNKDWIKKLEDDKKAAEKSKKDKETRKLKAKEAKEKAEADKLFLESFTLETATEEELVRYSCIKSIDITKNEENESGKELFGETKVDVIRAIIKEAEIKPVKVTRAEKKAVKKALKKETNGQQITFGSLFD